MDIGVSAWKGEGEAVLFSSLPPRLPSRYTPLCPTNSRQPREIPDCTSRRPQGGGALAAAFGGAGFIFFIFALLSFFFGAQENETLTQRTLCWFCPVSLGLVRAGFQL